MPAAARQPQPQRHAAPRPGITWGSYPERPDADDGALATGLRWAARQSSLLSPTRDPRPLAFARRVVAAGQALESLGEAELTLRLRGTRAQLAAKGLTDELTLEALALVREVSRRTLGMAAYDTQLTAVRIMLQNKLAEMATGEGKTLTAGLAAATAALAGIPVHVITANDYLVVRDADSLAPLFTALGLRVGTVTAELEEAARQVAWSADITYCTAKELAFDYLRDRMVLGRRRSELHLRLDALAGGEAPRTDRLRLRGLCMALVDEADSILLDEATTPLILSRSTPDPARLEDYRQALEIANALDPALDFRIVRHDRRAKLRSAGRERLKAVAADLGGVWRSVRRSAELVETALSALHCYERDKDYVIQDGAVCIVDEHTGRVAAGRAWSRGIHQIIELREGCTPTAENDPIAQITFQRFFPRYLRLGGMSGTLLEARAELLHTYGLPVVRVPLRTPSRRSMLPVRGFVTAEAKWQAVVESCRRCHDQGRPVLVGTDSVADSEHLGRMLAAAGLPHAVLNARQDRKEAAIVAIAGLRGQITVTTNMAGRGTDIRLGPGVAEAGGLHVIACQANSSGRTDRQLYGRCARQGEPGSVESLISLEDPAVARFLGPRLRALLTARYNAASSLPAALAQRLLAWPRQREENRHRARRAVLARQDRQQERLLALGGPGE